MNREIKFRGKRKDNLDWFYGSLIVCDNGETEIVWAQEPSIRVTKDVYPDTIGQYTGLKDKNGVEIYEGDIVKCDVMNNEDIFCVTWLDGKARFALTERPEDTTGWLYAYDVDTIEVWGNVYDNPELLKGGKE